MKRTIVVAIITLLFSAGVFAQKPSLNRAYNAFYEKDFIKAKEIIDLCVQDDKMKDKAQTWLYKGNIYFYLANQEYGNKQQNESYQILYPYSPSEAYEAFSKALAINKNIESYEMLTPAEGMSKLYSLLLIEGVDKLIANDYEGAKSVLESAVTSYEMKTPEHPLHGEIYYYYAYDLEMLGKKEEAKINYEKAIRDGSKNTSVYVRLLELYKEAGESQKIPETIDLAKQNIPNEPSILVAEVDYYWNSDPEKGKQLLDQLPANVYSNSDALVNIANLYIKMDDFQKAEELLKKADRLNPGNFVIVYNLGYCYLKLYETKFMEANQLGVDGKKEAAAEANKAAENYLDQAEHYFESALLSDPNDLNLLIQLKEIYARKKSPKYEQTLERIENLKK